MKKVDGRWVAEDGDMELLGKTGLFLTVVQRQALYDMLSYCTDEDNVLPWTLSADGHPPAQTDHRDAALEVLDELKRLGHLDHLPTFGRIYL